MPHVSYIPVESRKSNYKYDNNSQYNSTAYMPVPSLDPSDPQHATYITRKRDTEAEYLADIKAALSQAVQHTNFVDPIQIRRVHEGLMLK